MSDSTGGGFGPPSNWTPLVDSSGESGSGVLAMHETVTEIREHFEKQGPRLRYEGLAGKGAAGFVFRLVESGGRGPRGRVRRFALKRAASALHEDLMRAEIQWLKVGGARSSPGTSRPAVPPYAQTQERERETDDCPFVRGGN